MSVVRFREPSAEQEMLDSLQFLHDQTSSMLLRYQLHGSCMFGPVKDTIADHINALTDMVSDLDGSMAKLREDIKWLK